MNTTNLRKLSILTLAFISILFISACDNTTDETEKEVLASKVESYTNAESYTMDFTMKTRSSDKTIDIINKVDNRKEYISFTGEEYYQHFNVGTMVRYFRNDSGEWERTVYPIDDVPARSFISPDNINMEWFKEGDGGYHVLEKAHYDDMFGEANVDTIDIATIRIVDDKLEVAYTFRNQGMTFEYKAIIHSINETTVTLPQVIE